MLLCTHLEEYAHADLPFLIDVWVIDGCLETHMGWIKGVGSLHESSGGITTDCLVLLACACRKMISVQSRHGTQSRHLKEAHKA